MKLDGHVGLHPALAPLKALFDGGHLAVVQGVGYPNPSYSHFRSSEIWRRQDPSGPPAYGWLGRFYDNACNGLGQTHSMGMVALGASRVPPMLRAQGYIPPAISGPDEYRVLGGPETEEKENARRLEAIRKGCPGPREAADRARLHPEDRPGRLMRPSRSSARWQALKVDMDTRTPRWGRT